MRVLVVATTPQFTLGTRLMASLAAGLATRGDVVAIATAIRSDTESAVERIWPRLSVRSVSGSGWVRQAMSLRGIVTALRPEALLVGSEHDAVLAAFAVGKTGAIVRRLAAEERTHYAEHEGEPHDELPWRARFALSRAKVTPWGEKTLAIAWPIAERRDDSVQRLPLETTRSAPYVALLPGVTHDEPTSTALRAISHLRTRHPDLQLLLLGDAHALQATRLHAAALGMSDCVHITPLDALLHHELVHAGVLWVAATGDTGAVAAIAAMQQRIPVVLSSDVTFLELVTPGVSGLVVPREAPSVVVAELARIIGDANVRREMGEAAASKAAREHDWNAFVDEAAELLARAAGLGITRVTRRPSLTPA
jgi:glycosyltransferase involved in cell wall biosynthesis